MHHTKKSTIIATGLAMFSMFFGAGNVVFPLALGQYAQDNNFYAIIGMLITAVGVPFAGLIAMSLFDGDYKAFFARIGKIPGFLVAAIIMGLIGPFGALPRCVALSYSTMNTLFSGISISTFSIAACILIFLLTFRKNTIVEILGYFLTPLLIGSLFIIIVVGIYMGEAQPQTVLNRFDVFVKGLKDGYQTMDLLGAFFFSSVIIAGLKNALPVGEATPRSLIVTALKASCIGAFLLGASYVGFSYVASYHSAALAGAPADTLISQISTLVLGHYASIIASVAVALACLTTAIALAAVFAEFIHYDLTFGKFGYVPSLIVTLVITYFVSTLNFTVIAAFLQPILQICYPALIMLCLCNIAYKLWGVKMVKTPVLIVFLLSLVPALIDWF